METTPDAPEIGLVGRMLGVFYAPGEIFASLARKHSKADWLVPVIIGAIVAFIVAQQLMPIVMKMSRAQMEEKMRDMPAEERQAAEMVQGYVQTVGLVIAPIATFVMLFGFGALLLLLSRMMGGEGTYSQMLAVYAYSSLIGTLKDLVVAPLMVSKETMVVQTGLGLLFSDELLQTFAGSFLSKFELFTVWQAAIAAMGLAIVGKVAMGKAFAGVFVVVAVFVAIGAVVAGLSAAFGG